MPLGHALARFVYGLAVGKAELVKHAVDVIRQRKPGRVGVAAQLIQ